MGHSHEIVKVKVQRAFLKESWSSPEAAFLQRFHCAFASKLREIFIFKILSSYSEHEDSELSLKADCLW